MKLFLFALIATALLTLLAFAGLFGANTGAVLLGFCSLSGFVYPLLWVAIYRLYVHISTQYALIKRRG